jgi:hypothetical protein
MVNKTRRKKTRRHYIYILGYNGLCRLPIPDLNGNWSINYTSLNQMRILKIKDTCFLMHSLGTSLFYWQNFAKRSHSHCLGPWLKETLTPTSHWDLFGHILEASHGSICAICEGEWSLGMQWIKKALGVLVQMRTFIHHGRDVTSQGGCHFALDHDLGRH